MFSWFYEVFLCPQHGLGQYWYLIVPMLTAAGAFARRYWTAILAFFAKKA